MADQFVAEIRIFGFTFAPVGWALCQGQIMAISQNTAVFSLVGTFYGGNGSSNFALPNLQGMVPIDQGNGPGLTPRTVGETGGSTTVTLTAVPPHTHTAACNTANGDDYGPGNDVWATDAAGGNEYATASSGQMNAASLAPVGAGQAHNNLQPYLSMNYCIALQGIFPPRG
ncbi:MAG TPA: tail fiber protein [Bryobacteraceae bacterium]|nr:tail fiber protein [Bryobacteraceae bacterium]